MSQEVMSILQALDIDDTALMADSIETLQAILHEVVSSHCMDCTNEGLHLRDTFISHHLHHFRGLLARPPARFPCFYHVEQKRISNGKHWSWQKKSTSSK
jgi:hypothetical protein